MSPADELRRYLEDIVGPRHRYPEDTKARLKIEEVEAYMVNHFEAHNWEVYRQQVIYDSFTSIWDRKYLALDGVNIIARRQGKSDRTVIIAAHHDTVPRSP